MIVGLDDRLADRPVIERRRAAARDQLIGVREVRVAQPGAHGQGIAGGGEQERPARRVGLQRREAGLLELVEVEVDREALLGDVDRGLQVIAEREPAVVAHGRRPRGEVGGHAGGQRLVRCRGVVHRLARRGVDEHRGRARCGAGLAPVDRRHRVGARVVDDHEATTAGAGDPRHGHAERAGGGDGGVDGVAAALEHVDPGLAGADVHRGHGAAVPDGGGRSPPRPHRLRHPRRRRGGGRCSGRRRGADGGTQHRHERCESSSAHQSTHLSLSLWIDLNVPVRNRSET